MPELRVTRIVVEVHTNSGRALEPFMCQMASDVQQKLRVRRSVDQVHRRRRTNEHMTVDVELRTNAVKILVLSNASARKLLDVCDVEPKPFQAQYQRDARPSMATVSSFGRKRAGHDRN